ncbi:hypothetical protein [Methylobacterium iners]|uniref:Uncharacterized protein n=1 Tax=Methylobacterium iners TaxID=418707 RepID=A0ABQ4S6R7_9HYPH|nr:hypothetical protein [Methylobacterium iners]GJD97817.1 hypothetical protein OCOJLMKI_5056 [Methylobacterium iners]
MSAFVVSKFQIDAILTAALNYGADGAAVVVRDVVAVFVHPAHVEAAAKAGIPAEAMARNVMESLAAAFRAGLRYA